MEVERWGIEPQRLGCKVRHLEPSPPLQKLFVCYLVVMVFLAVVTFDRRIGGIQIIKGRTDHHNPLVSPFFWEYRTHWWQAAYQAFQSGV